jgi:hypothetical protein
MKSLLHSMAALGLGLGLLCLPTGCGRGKAPKEIPTTEIPGEAGVLFAKAPAPVKELAAQATAALAARDWSGAWVAFQALSERKDLTDEQRQFVASAIVSIGAELNKAGEQGDARAAAAQQMHRLSK